MSSMALRTFFCAVSLAMTALACSRVDDGPRSIDLGTSEPADTLQAALAPLQEALINAVAGRDAATIAQLVHVDFWLVDLRPGAEGDSGPDSVSYYQLIAGARPIAIDSVPIGIVPDLLSPPPSPMLGVQLPRERVLVTWRNTDQGWRARRMIVTR